MKVEEIKTVGIVGAGLMGHGIAQVFGIKGYRVNLYDKDPGILERAPGKIRANLPNYPVIFQHRSPRIWIPGDVDASICI